MAQCPVCNASVKDDFGLIECASCQAQLIVHMDGRVEYQGAESPPAEEEISDPPLEGLGFSSPPDDFGHEIELDENVNSVREDDLFDPSVDEVSFSSPEEDPPPLPEPEPELEDPAQEIFFDGGGDEPTPEPEEIYDSATSPGSPDLSDVANFGNSDISSGREGSLRYNLFIEGIDTSDVREAFREALTDRKLMWDTDQILRSVRNGRVNISNIGPAKAYILISRLRAMPVQVRWEQYAISQT